MLVLKIKLLRTYVVEQLLNVNNEKKFCMHIYSIVSILKYRYL